MDTETQVAVVERQAAVVPFADMERMATAIAKSGLFGIERPEQALALMLIAQAEGKHPALIARDYDIIKGRPAKKAEAMLRDFILAGGSVEWHELTDSKCSATFRHPSSPKPVNIDWDMKRADTAGLTQKENRDGSPNMWKKFPRQMLRSRTISEGVKTIFPVVTSGMYVPEEIDDFQEARNVTPLRQRMNAATSMEELNEIAKEVAGLPDDEKKVLREVYRTKGEALMAMASHASDKSATAQPEQPDSNGNKRPKVLDTVAQAKQEPQPETVSRDVI